MPPPKPARQLNVRVPASFSISYRVSLRPNQLTDRQSVKYYITAARVTRKWLRNIPPPQIPSPSSNSAPSPSSGPPASSPPSRSRPKASPSAGRFTPSPASRVPSIKAPSWSAWSASSNSSPCFCSRSSPAPPPTATSAAPSCSSAPSSKLFVSYCSPPSRSALIKRCSPFLLSPPSSELRGPFSLRPAERSPRCLSRVKFSLTPSLEPRSPIKSPSSSARGSAVCSAPSRPLLLTLAALYSTPSQPRCCSPCAPTPAPNLSPVRVSNKFAKASPISGPIKSSSEPFLSISSLSCSAVPPPYSRFSPAIS